MKTFVHDLSFPDAPLAVEVIVWGNATIDSRWRDPDALCATSLRWWRR